MLTVSMNVNGQSVSGEIEERTLLVQFLREHLKLTGTHVGCDTSQCGACVIHVDGVSIKSCTMLAIQAAGERAAGSVLASDAFFPFADNIEAAAKGGVTAIVQPGGSIRDQEVIETANKLGLAMVFTSVRHFRH